MRTDNERKERKPRRSPVLLLHFHLVIASRFSALYKLSNVELFPFPRHVFIIPSLPPSLFLTLPRYCTPCAVQYLCTLFPPLCLPPFPSVVMVSRTGFASSPVPPEGIDVSFTATGPKLNSTCRVATTKTRATFDTLATQ